MEEEVHETTPHELEAQEILADERRREADGEHVEEVEEPSDRERSRIRPVVIERRCPQEIGERACQDEEDHREHERVARAAVRDLPHDVRCGEEGQGAAPNRDERVPLGGFDHQPPRCTGPALKSPFPKVSDLSQSPPGRGYSRVGLWARLDWKLARTFSITLSSGASCRGSMSFTGPT